MFIIILVAFVLLFLVFYYDIHCDIVVSNGNEYLIMWYTYKKVRKYKILLKL